MPHMQDVPFHLFNFDLKLLRESAVLMSTGTKFHKTVPKDFNQCVPYVKVLVIGFAKEDVSLLFI